MRVTVHLLLGVQKSGPLWFFGVYSTQAVAERQQSNLQEAGYAGDLLVRPVTLDVEENE